MFCFRRRRGRNVQGVSKSPDFDDLKVSLIYTFDLLHGDTFKHKKGDTCPHEFANGTNAIHPKRTNFLLPLI